jgi:hypothetical protein
MKGGDTYMIIIHKYWCGCIGIPLGDSGKCILLDACDRNACDPPISFYIRDVGDKTSTPLSSDEQEIYIKKIDSLIADGWSMRSLASDIKAIWNRDK